jgi:hypothetical protein
MRLGERAICQASHSLLGTFCRHLPSHPPTTASSPAATARPSSSILVSLSAFHTAPSPLSATHGSVSLRSGSIKSRHDRPPFCYTIKIVGDDHHNHRHPGLVRRRCRRACLYHRLGRVHDPAERFYRHRSRNRGQWQRILKSVYAVD